MQIVVDRQGLRIGFDENLRKSPPEDLIVIMISCAELMFGASCATRPSQAGAIHDKCKQPGPT
jgi:hypothetical protein